MNKTLWILLALLTIPAAASAQVTHVALDPEPQTQRCSNIATAIHGDGDVVLVDYQGQWFDHPDGRRSQNGGVDGAGCGTERVARVNAAHDVVWEIRPNSAALGPADEVTALQALPDGRTVMTTTGPTAPSQIGGVSMRHATVVLLDANGEVVWKVTNEKAVFFTTARPFVGSGGELFVEYGLTNFGYAGGKFQLAGGREWRPRVNSYISLIARLDPRDGSLIWESSGSSLVSAAAGELLAVELRSKNRKESYLIRRLSYAGSELSKGATPWLINESMASAERFDGRLVMTTAQEHLNAQGRVDHRVAKLRIFDFTGKQLSSRTISDSAKIARMADGAPLRVLSPTSCRRGIVKDYSCQTDAIDVLTMQTPSSTGAYSKIRIPAGRFDYDEIAGLSTPGGLWLNGLSYYQAGANYTTPAVTRLYWADTERTVSSAPPSFVWRPVPPKSVAASPSPTLSF